jgi:AcrR family transcriptional regulator
MSTGTKQRIVTAMAELMRHQGYTATGVKQVAAASGAPMGSLYHHFPGGKPEIAAEAVRASGAAYIQLLPLLMDPYDDLREAIPGFFAAAGDAVEQTGWATMCPVASIGAEVADSQPQLRDVVAEVLASWVDQGAAYFRGRGVSEPQARELTVAMLGALEGAFVMARILRSTEPLRAAGASLTPHVQILLGRQAGVGADGVR